MTTNEEKQAKITAAIASAKAQKTDANQAANETPIKNDALAVDTEKQAKIEAAIARAKAAKAEATKPQDKGVQTKPSADAEKQAKIEAAIARAKAAKASALETKEQQSKED